METLTPSSAVWSIKTPTPQDELDALSAQCNVEPWIAQLFVQRGLHSLAEVRNYFSPEEGKLHDPFQMLDLSKAVDRLIRALHDGTHIRVYGDYDVDGTSAVAMMMDALGSLGATVSGYLPDRYAEGYGISLQGVDAAQKAGAEVLLALDCGITAIEAARACSAAGIDLIICDHHEPGTLLPEAYAILNPKRKNCPYPDSNLSGCGVGFKLLQGLVFRLNRGEEILEDAKQLVALSIAADIVPVTGENRVLAAKGLQAINDQTLPGLRALFNIAGHTARQKNLSDLVFILAPRLNAAGRMGHASEALEVLLAKGSDNTVQAVQLLEERNRERKSEDGRVTTEALTQLEEQSDTPEGWATIVVGEDWHKGVVGIVASRLIEHVYRPTVVLTRQGDTYTGSARSVEGVDLHACLEACSDLLESHGGHTMAAGMTIRAENLSLFRRKLNTVVRDQLGGNRPVPTLQASLALDVEQLTAKAWSIIKRMGPFGPGNMRPVFLSGPLVDAGKSRPVGDGSHLKLQVRKPDGTGPLLDGIGFGLGPRAGRFLAGASVYLMYALEENEWRGVRTLQLAVKDLRYEDELAL